MGRATAMGLVVLSVVMMTGPSAGRTDRSRVDEPVDIRFGPAVPCSVACAYWADTLNRDLDGDGREEVYFDACHAPYPSVSYHDIAVWAPPGAVALEVVIEPVIDWDLFVCPMFDDGLVRIPVYSTPECNRDVGWLAPVGCRERIRTTVEPTRGYILRAYSWADPFAAPGWYVFWSREAVGREA